MGVKRLNDITKVIPNCPECGAAGQVLQCSKIRGIVRMECLECKLTWDSLPEECPECGQWNGFVVKGLCSKCYALKYELKRRPKILCANV
jgi:transposase-like protein